VRAKVIYASRIFTPREDLADRAIVIEDGRITAVGRREEIRVPAGAQEISAKDTIVVPGFVDVHIHGAGGHDVMEAASEALKTVTAQVASHGTTSMLATTVSASADETCRSLEGIAAYIAGPDNRPASQSPRAEILGTHLEGPFISHARRGVHPEGALAKPSIPLLERLLAAAGGYARILTVAPELPGALELIDRARRDGLVAAIGHTDATYDQAVAAIHHGASHAVHVFNAMRPFSHRDTGVLGAVLTHPEVTAELIADGVHVDAPAIQILLASKGTAGVLLVSDGIAATGMPDGTYRLGTFDVMVSGGVARNADGRLAGSTLTLDRAIRHMVSLGVSPIEAVRMATLAPAERLGISAKKGVIAPGADADLVFLTSDLNVKSVMTRGVGID
jgi:N-acetylglucosamine-6-phosphate deacetylase